MELWIRTQDKMRLVRPRRLAIKRDSRKYGGDWYIYESENSLRYGNYPTKEQVLKIFDEIQDILCSSKPNDSFVYQMPEEVA